MIYRAYKYPLLPTESQVRTFIKWFGVVRHIWNDALEKRNNHYASCKVGRETLDYFSQQKDLTLMRQNTPWICEVPAVVCRSPLINLDRAWKKVFKEGAGSPRFKSKHNSKASFSIIGNLNSIHIRKKTPRHSEIKLPKIGWVKFRDTRELP